MDKHRVLLDNYAGIDSLLLACATAFENLSQVQKALSKHVYEQEQIQKEYEYVKHICDELEQVKPEKNEGIKLEEKKQTLKKAGVIDRTLQEIRTIFLHDSSIKEKILRGQKLTQKHADVLHEMQEITQACDRIYYELEEIVEYITQIENETQGASFELETVEDRLSLLKEHARKNRVGVDELADFWEELQKKIESYHANGAMLKKLEHDVKIHLERYDAIAQKIQKKRIEAAKDVEEKMNNILPCLKLPGATVKICCERGSNNVTGWDHVSFYARLNPATEYQPIQKSASGGELSRLLLAFKNRFCI